MTSITDLLSSSSLLLAVLAVLLGLWYGEVDKESKTGVAGLAADAKELAKDEIRSVLWRRAVPLLVASGAVALVFACRALILVCETARCLGEDCPYSEVKAAFLLTEALTVFIFAVILIKIFQLARKLRE